jgi:hypothetical protein
MAHDNDMVLDKIGELYHMLIRHDGFGEMSIETRILKRGQKEVIIHCGKQYRFVVDAEAAVARQVECRSSAGARPGKGSRFA